MSGKNMSVSPRPVQPFAIVIEAWRYWLTRLLSRKERVAMYAVRAWLLDQSAALRSSSAGS